MAAAVAGVLLLLAPADPARAAEAAWPVPPCAAEGSGLVACVAGKLCVCRGAPPPPGGFRWDCGVLRPGCGPGTAAGSAAPATLDPYPYPLPSALSLDRSSTNVTTVTGDRARVHTGDRGRR